MGRIRRAGENGTISLKIVCQERKKKIQPQSTSQRFGINDKYHYYPTALRRVQITLKTSTNITRYLYSRGPVRQVFSQRASDELD